MKSLITRWNLQPLYPIGLPCTRCSPVHNCRKFSTVLGPEGVSNGGEIHLSANSSNFRRPEGIPEMDMSRKTTGFEVVIFWKKQIRLLSDCDNCSNRQECNSTDTLYHPVYAFPFSSSYYSHRMRRVWHLWSRKRAQKCEECGGSGICEHGRQKARC